MTFFIVYNIRANAFIDQLSVDEVANKAILLPVTLTDKVTPVVLPISLVDVSANDEVVPNHAEYTLPARTFEPLVNT